MRYCKKCDEQTDRYKSGQCRPCALKRNHEAYEKNKSKYLEQQKNYRAENAQKIRDYRIKYKDENRERINEKNRLYRESNKDQILARRRRRWAENKASIAEKRRAYRSANRKIIADQEKRYAEKNKGKLADRRRKSYEKNKESISEYKKANRTRLNEMARLHNQNRRARKKSTGVISRERVGRLIVLQKNRCACCKCDLRESGYHLDHIMPLALGGTNTDGNTQLLCPTCNLQKNARHPVDFMRQKGFLI